MIGLFRIYLRPYTRPLVLVMILLLIAALGNLYLPDLNGEIIDQGVATGDTEFILQTGALMLAVSAVLVVASVIAVYWSRPDRDGLRARRAPRDLRQGRDVLAGRGQPDRSGLAHHPQHERRPAGPDGRVHGPDDHGLGTDPHRGRDHHGAAHGRAVVRDPRRRPAADGRSSSRSSCRGPSRCSGPSRPSSTGSTRSCARRCPASGSSGRSSGPSTRKRASMSRAATCSTPRSRSPGCSRSPSRR